MLRSRDIFLLQLAFFWPVAAIAAQVSFARSFYEGDMLLDLLMTFGISLLVGSAALLTFIKNEYRDKGKVDRLWLIVAQKMLVSQVAGFGMYLMADGWNMSRSTTGISIIAAAWLGDIFLDKLAGRYGGTDKPT